MRALRNPVPAGRPAAAVLLAALLQQRVVCPQAAADVLGVRAELQGAMADDVLGGMPAAMAETIGARVRSLPQGDPGRSADPAQCGYAAAHACPHVSRKARTGAGDGVLLGAMPRRAGVVTKVQVLRGVRGAVLSELSQSPARATVLFESVPAAGCLSAGGRAGLRTAGADPVQVVRRASGAAANARRATGLLLGWMQAAGQHGAAEGEASAEAVAGNPGAGAGDGSAGGATEKAAEIARRPGRLEGPLSGGVLALNANRVAQLVEEGLAGEVEVVGDFTGRLIDDQDVGGGPVDRSADDLPVSVRTARRFRRRRRVEGRVLYLDEEVGKARLVGRVEAGLRDFEGAADRVAARRELPAGVLAEGKHIALSGQGDAGIGVGGYAIYPTLGPQRAEAPTDAPSARVGDRDHHARQDEHQQQS